MADRANEPLPRRREPSASSKLLTPELAAELRPPAAQAPAETTRRSAASAALSFFALLDPLPSDYYLG